MSFFDKILGKKSKPEMEKLELPPLPPLEKQSMPQHPAAPAPKKFELPELEPDRKIPTSRVEIKKTMPADITIPTGPPRVDPSHIKFPSMHTEHHEGARPELFGERKPVLKKPSFMQRAMQKPNMQPRPMPGAHPAPTFPGQMHHPAEQPVHHEEFRELHEPDKKALVPSHVDTNKPKFIDINDFRSILSNIGYIKGKLKESSDVLERLNDTKLEEDKAFEKWRLELEDVQRKMLFIDKSLFEK